MKTSPPNFNVQTLAQRKGCPINLYHFKSISPISNQIKIPLAHFRPPPMATTTTTMARPSNPYMTTTTTLMDADGYHSSLKTKYDCQLQET